MKNKIPIIFLLILISVIIFCLVMFLVIYLNKGMDGMINIGKVSENIVLEKNFELLEIENIEVIQDYGDVTFKENEDNNIKVEIYGRNEKDTRAELINNKLKIENTNRRNFTLINFGVRKSEIIVYIPKGYAGDINIKVDCGNATLDNIENANLKVECNAGNVKIKKAKNANIKCNLGDVKAEEILNKCNIEVDAGNVKIEKLTLNEDSKIKVDLGDVTIDEINEVYIEADTDLGKTNINQNYRNSEVTLKINVDCGNISVAK